MSNFLNRSTDFIKVSLSTELSVKLCGPIPLNWKGDNFVDMQYYSISLKCEVTAKASIVMFINDPYKFPKV